MLRYKDSNKNNSNSIKNFYISIFAVVVNAKAVSHLVDVPCVDVGDCPPPAPPALVVQLAQVEALSIGESPLEPVLGTVRVGRAWRARVGQHQADGAGQLCGEQAGVAAGRAQEDLQKDAGVAGRIRFDLPV